MSRWDTTGSDRPERPEDPEDPTTLPEAEPTPGGRAFWGLFAGAWLVYGGLIVTVLLAEDMPPARVLGAAAGMVAAYAAPAAILAWRRRELLRPERSLLATAGLHVVVAVGYTLVATGLVALLFRGGDPLVADLSVDPLHVFISRAATGLFLYAVFAGFLMWTESLARVQESRTLAAREAELRARAEAKALRAQFNPHFVFNTLHSLMLLVRADPPAAERAIEDVAELIRYASVLQREGIDVVPLAKELEVARRYLALEKLRLDDRLAVEWEVDDEARPRTLPPFSLQTLLENAIKHGVSPRTEGGTVRVRAELDGGSPDPEGVEGEGVADLVITVEDDGEGAQAERVGEVEGRGLDLVRQRLANLYGARGSLRWETAPGEGFRVVLKVPGKGVRGGERRPGPRPGPAGEGPDRRETRL